MNLATALSLASGTIVGLVGLVMGWTFGWILESHWIAALRGGIDTLIMVGVSTSGCIRASALDACQHGFIPIVVREAVGDRDPRPHEANLFDIDAKYGDVVSEAEAMDYLHRIGNRRPGARAAG